MWYISLLTVLCGHCLVSNVATLVPDPSASHTIKRHSLTPQAEILIWLYNNHNSEKYY